MIPKFYEDREIFITGGSGVVGTALIDKLLRSCNVRKIYLLLRPKSNNSIEQRLEKVKKAMVFRQLKLQKPSELNEKLVAIPGDATLALLGITPEYRKIMENVSIVFHCAATVRFDEPLRVALKINVGGTLEAIKFAESLKQLKVFMHVSTFFSNPYLKYVEPKYYESTMDWKFCLNLIERNDIAEDELDIITKKLIVGFPNTYTFTKNLAESLVNDYKHKLPVCIYRPSIVFFALEDPEPGFSPSLMGAVGIFGIIGAGVLKIVYAQKNLRLDFTPLDIGIKTMLYYALKTAQVYEETKKPSEVPVYITSSCTHTDFTLSDYVKLMRDYNCYEKSAYEKNLLIPGASFTDSRLIYLFLLFFKQILPSLIIDFLLIISGRKPVLMGVQRKIFQTLEVLQPFLFNDFKSPGTTFYNEMSKMFQGTDFCVNILKSTNNKYTCLGLCNDMSYSVREILFKEDPKTLPRSRIILHIKIWLYRLLQVYLVYIFYLKVKEYGKNNYSNWKLEKFNSTFDIKEY